MNVQVVPSKDQSKMYKIRKCEVRVKKLKISKLPRKN